MLSRYEMRSGVKLNVDEDGMTWFLIVFGAAFDIPACGNRMRDWSVRVSCGFLYREPQPGC